MNLDNIIWDTLNCCCGSRFERDNIRVILRSWDSFCSPEAAASMMQNIIPESMSTDEMIQTLSENLLHNQNTELWKVWHEHLVEIGSIQDFATTNLIIATVSRNET